MIELDSRMDALAELTGMPPDSPVSSAIWEMAGDYTSAVDPGGDCAWFWVDCDLGRAPMQASKADGETRTIRDVEDLLWLME